MGRLSGALKVISYIWGCLFVLYGLMGAAGMSPGGAFSDSIIQMIALAVSVTGVIYFFPNAFITKTKNRIVFFVFAYTLPIILFLILGIKSMFMKDEGYSGADNSLFLVIIFITFSLTPILSLLFYKKTGNS
jgi:hypothetical protein